MSAIEDLLRQPAAQVMGWALLHFVWQGALVGGLTAIALAALRKSAADIRYVVSTIGLSLMLTLPAVTAMQLWRSAGAGASVPGLRLRRNGAGRRLRLRQPRPAGRPRRAGITRASRNPSRPLRLSRD